MSLDTHGTPHPHYNEAVARFRVYLPFKAHDPSEEPGWTYQLRVVDRKYQDSDGFPIEAVAGGDSWEEAYATAARYIESALASEVCIF
jgi:hypothetical protein